MLIFDLRRALVLVVVVAGAVSSSGVRGQGVPQEVFYNLAGDSARSHGVGVALPQLDRARADRPPAGSGGSWAIPLDGPGACIASWRGVCN